ncbi:MAG: hypothetical protein IT458_03600 [Planctomycetes bacterium]|nr:hypothetical protein [Planctomycetota bacterium]
MVRTRLPSYRRHKPTGQAVVTLNGRDHYLGRYGTAASVEAYNRLLAEWLARGRTAPADEKPPSPRSLTVNEVVAAFWAHATQSYRLPDGSPSSEIGALRSVLRPLVEVFGDHEAAAFGPRAAKDLVERWIQRGWCRRTVNHALSRLWRVFAWAVAEDLVPGEVHYRLLALKGLRRFRSSARETEPVQPVAWKYVEPVLAVPLPELLDVLGE